LVYVDGEQATVNSASTTQLQINVPTYACKPSRTTNVIVSVDGRADTASVGVKPSGTPWSLSVGEGLYDPTPDCLQLAAGSGGEKYIVGVFSHSEVPTNLTQFTSAFTAGNNLSSDFAFEQPSLEPDQEYFEAPGLSFPIQQEAAATSYPEIIVDPTDQAINEWHEEGKARITAAVEARMAEGSNLSDVALEPQGSSEQINAEAARNLTRYVGEVVPVRYWDPDAGNDLNTYTTMTTVVQYIGSNTLYMEDVTNPLYPSFTYAEYQAMDATFGGTTLPTLENYIGSLIDLDYLGMDDHGRVAVVISKEVNDFALGYVLSFDVKSQATYAASNQAEIFYGIAPDPSGIYGTAMSKSYVLSKYPGLMAHEVTHILHNTQDTWGGGATLESWEKEGVATMMEWVVGNAVLGHGGSGQNIGTTDFLEGYYANWYQDLFSDGSNYFGYGSSSSVAPHECSWLSSVSTNCNDYRALYRAANLFRFVLDWYGPSYSGGEAALMRAMSKSDYTGYANLVNATGASSIGYLLTLWGLNLYSDGRTGVVQTAITAGMTYWDFTPIMDLGYYALDPAATSSDTASETYNVRAGSTHYTEWSPATTHAPTSWKFTSSGGGTLPSTVGMWIFRVQ